MCEAFIVLCVRTCEYRPRVSRFNFHSNVRPYVIYRRLLRPTIHRQVSRRPFSYHGKTYHRVNAHVRALSGVLHVASQDNRRLHFMAVNTMSLRSINCRYRTIFKSIIRASRRQERMNHSNLYNRRHLSRKRCRHTIHPSVLNNGVFCNPSSYNHTKRFRSSTKVRYHRHLALSRRSFRIYNCSLNTRIYEFRRGSNYDFPCPKYSL